MKSTNFLLPCNNNINCVMFAGCHNQQTLDHNKQPSQLLYKSAVITMSDRVRNLKITQIQGKKKLTKLQLLAYTMHLYSTQHISVNHML